MRNQTICNITITMNHKNSDNKNDFVSVTANTGRGTLGLEVLEFDNHQAAQDEYRLLCRMLSAAKKYNAIPTNAESDMSSNSERIAEIESILNSWEPIIREMKDQLHLMKGTLNKSDIYAPSSVPVNVDQLMALISLVGRKDKINTIKLVRAMTHVGLKEAKDLVDKYWYD